MLNIVNIDQYKVYLHKFPMTMANWITGKQNSSICKIIFFDQFYFPQLTLNLSEYDIELIIRYIVDYLEFGGMGTHFPLSYYNEDLCSYTVYIDRDESLVADSLLIKEFNPKEERLRDKIRLNFYDNVLDSIFSFIEILYTYFLQDTTGYEYIGDYLYGG